jgi:hypothetical protein
MPIPLLLQPQSLLGIYEKFADETASKLLQWFPDRDAVERAQNVQYDTIQYSSDAAKINTDGGAPNSVRRTVRGTVMGGAITMHEEVIVPSEVICSLRDLGSNKPGPASAWIAREMKNLRLRIGKRKAVLAAQCLGIASGNLSFTLPGLAAATTVSLNYTGAHQAIGSAWDTAATDILADIQAAKLLVATDGGKQATEMVLNSHTGIRLMANDGIMDLLNDVAKGEVLQTGQFTKLAGLNVHYVDEFVVDDVTLVATALIPNHHVAIFAGDSADRGFINMHPNTVLAQDSHRGPFFNVIEGKRINDPITIEYKYNVFPYLPNPDEIVYDTTVVA